MQTQKEFTENLKEAVKKLIGNEYKVEIHCTEKVNVETLHALVIINGESAVSPNFYIENFYRDYLQGEATVQEIAEYIVHAYSNHTSLSINENKLKTCLNDSRWMKERLFLKLINRDKNKEFLKQSIYMDFNELALVLYVMISDNEDGISQIRVTTRMCEHFGWNEKEILNYALENTAHIFPYKQFLLHELLQKTVNCIGTLPIMNIPEESKMIVLTNNRGIHGATAAFYPKVLKSIAEEHGTSLFLLPSSIHEFLMLEDNGIHDPEKLAKMVKQVNSSAVPPEDILSDNVYYYGYSSGILSVYKDGKMTKIAMP